MQRSPPVLLQFAALYQLHNSFQVQTFIKNLSLPLLLLFWFFLYFISREQGKLNEIRSDIHKKIIDQKASLRQISYNFFFFLTILF